MTTLSDHLERYLAVRRALGFQLVEHGRQLGDFVAFAEARGETSIRTDTALAWAAQSTGPSALSERLSFVRLFASYLKTFEPATEIPAGNLVPGGTGRTRPYIYSREEINALIDAADGLPSETMRVAMATMVGLMAATGIRPREACYLDTEHIDLDGGTLTVWHSKNGRSRRLPLHETTTEALAAHELDAHRRRLPGEPFFADAKGSRITSQQAGHAFRHMREAAAIKAGAGQRPPRLGDLRHTFAVTTLVSWYRRGLDVQANLPVLSAYMGHVNPNHTYWYLDTTPELMAIVTERLEAMGRLGSMTALAPLMQAFFVEHLANRRVSRHTVAAYRDCCKLLLAFAQTRTGKAPSKLDLADIDAALVGAFLDHLESGRRNGIHTRNLRLTAIHSFFSYAALRCPAEADVIARVLAVPSKRHDVNLVSFLTRDETKALLAAPDRTTSLGRRDHAVLLVGVETGLRVSGLTALRWGDLSSGTGANVYTRGKGRKERNTPLTPSTARLLAQWQREHDAEPEDPVFVTVRWLPLSTDAVEDLVDKHVAVAERTCPSLRTKRVTPHTLRHTCAMNLLRAGVDLATIALILGHSSTRATEIYLHADLALKEKALSRLEPNPTAARRYRPPDQLLAFLEGL